jgi:hypothetical protein
MRTEKEIKAEVKGLEAIKSNPKFRRYSAFGDDHFRSIEIQKAVLQNDWDIDDIDERYSDSDQHSIAYDTLQWKEGKDVDETPTGGWKCLIRE